MKTTSSNSGLKVKTSIKAGGLGLNHNRTALKVRSNIRGGYTCSPNHNASLIRLH